MFSIAEDKMISDYEDSNRNYRKWFPERKITDTGWVGIIIRQYVNEIL